MKTGKTAKALDVDPKTIINWTDTEGFGEFFSLGALAKDGRTQRDFNESDLVVLNTIRARRNLGDSWEDIGAFLRSGKRETELPPTAMLVETSAPIAQYGRVVALTAERDAALAHVKELEKQLLGAKEENKELQERLLRDTQALYKEIGRLQAKLEMYERDEPG
jgi:DNA-binding transcriptional MerR regulator